MVTFPISSLSENKTKLKKKFIRTLYNLDFRVLLGRLGADKKDFYNLLEQIITFLLLFAGLKKKKNDELPSGIKIHPSPLPIL